MPLLEGDAGVPVSSVMQIEPQPTVDPARTPSFDDTLHAAFRLNNSVASAIAWAGRGNQPQDLATPDPNYDAFSNIKGYEANANSFLFAHSPADTTRIKAQIDAEDQDRKIMDSAGWRGWAAGLEAGALDPIFFVPVGGAALKGGESALKFGLNTARAGALGLTAQESLLQMTQETRTLGESATNVAAGTVLAGLLGGGASAVFGKFAGHAAALDRDMKIPSGADALVPNTVSVTPEDLAADTGGAVGAQVANRTQARLKSAFGAEKVLRITSPGLRTAMSPEVETRRASQLLAESPYIYQDNALGIAQTPAVETLIKTWHGPLYESLQMLDQQFTKYRTGTAAGRGTRLIQQGKDMLDRGQRDYLNFDEFKEAVGQAMRRGDVSEIPEVAEAAKHMRKNIFDPLKDEAVNNGQLPEDVAPETATSYLSRVWNTEKIIAQRPRFLGMVSEWLKTQQSVAERGMTEHDLRQTESIAAADQHATTARTTLNAMPAMYKERDAFTGIAERTAMARERSQAKIKALESELNTSEKRRATISDEGRRAEAEAQSKRINAKLDDEYQRLSDIESKLDQHEYKLRGSKEQIAKSLSSVDEVRALEKKARANAESSAVRAAELSQFARLSDTELKDISEQIAQKLIGTPGGRINYEKIPIAVVRAPALKERTFSIPDLFSGSGATPEDFLESDVERIAKHYVRTMAPDVELAKKFGSADMTETIKKINDAYGQRATDAATDSERKVLEKNRTNDLRDMSAMRDRLRGTYAAPSDPNGLIHRGARLIGQWNYVRMMGGMTVSSLSDIGSIVMKEGITRAFKAGIVPMIRNFKSLKLSAQEVKKAGTALDMVLDSRAESLADIGDDFGKRSKFERGMDNAGSLFGVAALMNPWNAALKQFAGVLAQDRILEHSLALVSGKLSKHDTELLAASHIDANLAERIVKQFKAHGVTQDGTRIANVDSWTDPEAAQTYRASVVRSVDSAVVTPGVGDKPLVLSKFLGSPELAKLIFQFRSFSFAATQRVVIAGLQRRDLATMNGMMTMVGLGMLTYYIKTKQAGRETSDDPATWVLEGIDRSGVTGSLFDINNIIEKLSRGNIGLSRLRGGPQMTRYASRNMAGAVLGPTLGTIEDVFQVAGAASDGSLKDSDKRAMLRLVPASNLFYIRHLMDEMAMEQGGH